MTIDAEAGDRPDTEGETRHDALDPARATALFAALGRPRDCVSGDVLPPFFHQLYFWSPQPPGQLGRDGHPKVGGLIPDMGLPRRMWAGGALEFHAPLRAGQPATCRTRLADQTRKEGRSGPLGFVTISHEIIQDGTLRVTERQDLVYREEADPTAPAPVPPEAPGGEETAEAMTFDTTLLFRYSALTFNGHRIHYDRDYARDVEGYGGLVVHGPLLAQLLMLKAEAELGPLSTFSFRARSPLVDTETATLCRAGGRLWVRGPDGRLCMEAEATAG